VQAVYLRAPKEIQIKDIPSPVRCPGEALVRVRATGVCGSDITAYRGINPTVVYPLVVGHESAGDIIEVDPNSSDLKLGNRVVVEPYLACGRCYPCSLGRTNNCQYLQVRGVHVNGTMAEYISHPERLLHKIPEHMSWIDASLSEPLSIALHAVHRAEIKPGEHVVITGAGTIGLLVAQVTIKLGAIPIVIDPMTARLAVARSMGLTYAIEPGAETIETVREITNGRMAEVLIEASGAESAITQALDHVAYAGRVVLVGWPKKAIATEYFKFIRKELDVRGSRNSAGEIPEAVRLIAAGQVQLHSFISSIVDLAKAPEAIVQQAASPEQFIKVVSTRS